MLWQRLLGRPASESRRLCHGDGATSGVRPPPEGVDVAYPLSSSLLATVEAIFNLGTLGRNDTSAAPMSDMFRGGIP